MPNYGSLGPNDGIREMRNTVLRMTRDQYAAVLREPVLGGGGSSGGAATSAAASLLRVLFVPATNEDQAEWLSSYSIDQRDHDGYGAPAATFTLAPDTEYDYGRRIRPSLAKAVLLADLPGRAGADQFSETADSQDAKAVITFLTAEDSGQDPIESGFTVDQYITANNQPNPPVPTSISNSGAETWAASDKALITFDASAGTWSYTKASPSGSDLDPPDDRIDVLWWSLSPLTLGSEDAPKFRFGYVSLENGQYHSVGVDPLTADAEAG